MDTAGNTVTETVPASSPLLHPQGAGTAFPGAGRCDPDEVEADYRSAVRGALGSVGL